MTMVGAGGGWGISQWATHQQEVRQKVEAQQREDDRLLRSYLLPLQKTMKLDASVYDQLTSRFVPPSTGVLEWYIAESRRVGPDKLSLPYGLITDLIQTNAEMLTLMDGYAKEATPLSRAFSAELDKFRDHAHTYAIRFKVLPTIILSGESLPSWKTFPAGLPSAVDEEIAARQKHRADPSGIGPKSKFERKFNVTVRRDSSGGAPCNAVVALLKTDYPTGTFEVVKSDAVDSRRAIPSQVEYSYICTVSVRVVDEF
jgi:hypothetical protein